MKKLFSKYKILIIAISVSFIWHIFWLSAVKVVIVPNKIEPVRFSKVSFLGPILSRGIIEAKAVQERSILEKRYLYAIAKARFKNGIGSEMLSSSVRAGIFSEERLNPFIDEALSGSKLEPSRVLE